MKKFTLLAGLLLAMVVTATAQSASTKVSKTIKVFDWLNAAVVDGNQVEGGLHSYVNWAEVTTGASAKLKIAQVKIGMVITLTDIAGDKSIKPASYRLKTWTTPTALPTVKEWERIGDMIVVADIAARDLLITGPANASLATGTTVMVKSNAMSIPELFVYVNGLVDVNGDGSLTATDLWYSLSSTSTTSSGYILFDNQPVGTTPASISASSGFYDGITAAGAVTIGTSKRFTAMPTTLALEYDLVAGITTLNNVPIVALPAAWASPSFYVSDGTGLFQLQDCWIKTYLTIDNTKYQVWTADNAFSNGTAGVASGTFKLVIR